MSKIKKKFEVLDVILVLIILVLIIISLVIVAKKNAKPETEQSTYQFQTKQEDNKDNNVQVVRTDEEIVKKLSTQGERDRMEYYCGEYMKHIENEEYEKAYNMLYSEFKEKYFPTVEEFEKYVKKTYPSDFALDYDDITRQGDIYVLRLKIFDVLGSKNDEKVQRVVIKENNYNDYVMSFQVI